MISDNLFEIGVVIRFSRGTTVIETIPAKLKRKAPYSKVLIQFAFP
jgi:hypothetical protein